MHLLYLVFNWIDMLSLKSHTHDSDAKVARLAEKTPRLAIGNFEKSAPDKASSRALMSLSQTSKHGRQQNLRLRRL